MSSDVVNDAFSTINERVQKEKEQNEKEEGKERQKNAWGSFKSHENTSEKRLKSQKTCDFLKFGERWDARLLFDFK